MKKLLSRNNPNKVPVLLVLNFVKNGEFLIAQSHEIFNLLILSTTMVQFSSSCLLVKVYHTHTYIQTSESDICISWYILLYQHHLVSDLDYQKQILNPINGYIVKYDYIFC